MVSQETRPGTETAGDQAARPDWAALYQRHRDRMLRTAAVRLRRAGSDTDHAQDIVNKVFVEMIAKAPADVSDWEAYLVTVTTRRTIDHLRLADNSRVTPAGIGDDDQADLLERPADADVAEDALDRVMGEQLRHRVRGLLAGLPDQQRQVVQMRLFGSMSNVEIAPILGVTPQRVSQLWASGFGALRSALRDDPAILPLEVDGTSGD